MPIGESAFASVFLVTSAAPGVRLLRMKIWKTPAPPGFIQRFFELRAELERWRHPAIPALLAAAIDAAGCPSVLSEFRQGVPLVDAAKSGLLDRLSAAGRLASLRGVAVQGHARGLVHGGIVSGNVMVHAPRAAAYLLDFGLALLVAPGGPTPYTAEEDLAGFAALDELLRNVPSRLPAGGHL
jgi:hypothetical protein